MSKIKQNVVTTISNRSKVLKRPARFIGAVTRMEQESYIIEDDSIIKKKLKYVPGLIKIVEEVIDNSIDEAVRTNYKFANKIDVKTSDSEISVQDNGRGIPVIPTKNEDGSDGDTLMPEGAWTLLNTGSNFDDEDDNITMGQNGEGVSLTNIFSKTFQGETCDGKKKLILNAVDSMNSYEKKVTAGNKQYTKVSFTPDYKLFKITKWDDIHEKVLEFKLAALSIAYPDIKFTLNGKVIKIQNFKKLVNMISSEAEIIETENLHIAVVANPTDDYSFIHIVNGINSFNGGKPLDWVTNSITTKLKDKIAKKYPKIKVGDIKNKLFVVAIFKNMHNPRFEDQIKSVCANTQPQFKSQIGDIDFEKYAIKIHKSNAIMDPILETFKLKEEALKRLELKNLKKVKKEVVFEKYLPSTGLKKHLLIVEGDSAMGGLSSELGRQGYSYYGLKGKPLNAYQATHAKFMSNKELKELFEIITNDPHQMILFATDQDLDGFAIRGLLIGFFHKYFPEYLSSGKIGFLQTPLIVTTKGSKILQTFYSFDEYNKYTERYGEKHSFKYLKGLGSYEDGQLEQVIKKDGMEKLIDIIDYDASRDDVIIENWLGADTSDKRKEYILANEFDLSKV